MQRECVAAMEVMAREIADENGLSARVESLSDTPPVCNDAGLVETLGEVAGRLSEEGLPLPVSEDFGHFAAAVPGCYIIYRTGSAPAQVHQKGYDFNDEALDGICRLWLGLLRRRWGVRSG